jgi:hypothetical protein
LIAFDRPSVFAKFPNSKYRLIDSQHEQRSPQHCLIAFDRPSVFAEFPNSKYRLIDSQHEQRSPQYCLIAFDRPSVFAEFPISKELYSDPLINFLSNLKDSSRQPLSPNDFENVDYFK